MRYLEGTSRTVIRECSPMFLTCWRSRLAIKPKFNGVVTLGSVIHHFLNQPDRSFSNLRRQALGICLQCVARSRVFLRCGRPFYSTAIYTLHNVTSLYHEGAGRAVQHG